MITKSLWYLRVLQALVFILIHVYLGRVTALDEGGTTNEHPYTYTIFNNIKFKLVGNKAKREAFVSEKVAQGMSRTQAKIAYSGGKKSSTPKPLPKHRDSEHDGVNIDRSWDSPWQDYAHTSEDT